MSNDYTKRDLANDILTAIDAYCDAAGIKYSDLHYYRGQLDKLLGEYRNAKLTSDNGDAHTITLATPDGPNAHALVALMVHMALSLPCGDDSDD